MEKIYITKSSNETKKIGEKLAKKILSAALHYKNSGEKATVLGLQGNLGGGKTTFLQGFAKGLGIKEKITSPTFVILKKFQVSSFPSALLPPAFGLPKASRAGRKAKRAGKFQEFYHIDCYRIEKIEEILNIGFREIISNSYNIVAIEWVDKIEKILPKNTIKIKFGFINEDTRKIIIETKNFCLKL